MIGRLQDPTEVGWLSPKGVSSPSLGKHASFIPLPPIDARLVGEGLLRAISFAQQHPAVTGGVVGGISGALRDTKERSEDDKKFDPRGGTRNRLFSIAGGVGGGMLLGDFMERNATHPKLVPMTLQQILTTGRNSMRAGQSISDALAPLRPVPSSVSGLLGDKKRYSEKDVQQKYQEEFGTKKQTTDVEHEARFISALRDIYHEGEEGRALAPPASKKEIVKEKARAFGAAIGMAAVPALFGFARKSSLLPLLPTAIQHVAGAARTLKQQHGPAVQVDKQEATSRGKFNDDQLRRLLRGLGVEEVKEHVIK